jgi:hypothetical protein
MTTQNLFKNIGVDGSNGYITGRDYYFKYRVPRSNIGCLEVFHLLFQPFQAIPG